MKLFIIWTKKKKNRITILVWICWIFFFKQIAFCWFCCCLLMKWNDFFFTNANTIYTYGNLNKTKKNCFSIIDFNHWCKQNKKKIQHSNIVGCLLDSNQTKKSFFLINEWNRRKSKKKISRFTSRKFSLINFLVGKKKYLK